MGGMVSNYKRLFCISLNFASSLSPVVNHLHLLPTGRSLTGEKINSIRVCFK